ncbi:unnamed protein product [Dovyalis caffra]|uniref:Uncharacterized protein n=1 Tax=Dovyalis caffra TaxID=77055 RepID=A0AAV1R2K4_9ROSI|nr:unnamed protein product [Dovyalis caffra]
MVLESYKLATTAFSSTKSLGGPQMIAFAHGLNSSGLQVTTAIDTWVSSASNRTSTTWKVRDEVFFIFTGQRKECVCGVGTGKDHSPLKTREAWTAPGFVTNENFALAGLYSLSFVGSLFSTMTFTYLALYEQNKMQLDEIFGQSYRELNNSFRDFRSKLVDKIPRGKDD